MRAEGKLVDKKRSSSTGVKISKSTDEEVAAPQSPTRQQSRGGNGSNHVSNSAAGRKKNDVAASGRSVRRSNSAVTAVFWILLAFGFFQILFYSPDDVVLDEHWFDKSSWKISSSAASSRNRTKAKAAQRPFSESAKEQQKQEKEPTKKEKAPLHTEHSEAKVEVAKSYSQVELSSRLDSANVSSSVKQESSAAANSTTPENPIMQVLVAAGLKDIDPKDLEGLPSPETLTALYGPLKEPVVVGMETCATYRDKVPPSERVAAVAGMFNTGTNAMAFHLRQNINIKNTWQVPWGKHRMEYVRLNHTAEGLEHVNKQNVLPIVLIRDPLYWLQSMCKSPYAAHWPSRPGHCPNLVPDEVDRRSFQEYFNATSSEAFHVRIVFDKNQIVHWDSLAHLWSDWYRLYLKAEYPRLMFRFEDLLFHGPFIMRRIAECAGVTVPETFHFQTGSAKGHGSHATFLDAIIKTGDLQKRIKNFTPEDLAYASKHLDPDLMRIFRYNVPDPKSLTTATG